MVRSFISLIWIEFLVTILSFISHAATAQEAAVAVDRPGYLMYVENEGFSFGALDAVDDAGGSRGRRNTGRISVMTEAVDGATAKVGNTEIVSVLRGNRRDTRTRRRTTVNDNNDNRCPGASDPLYFDKDSYPQCFDETWDTQQKRLSLWGAVRTAVPPERRISHIILSHQVQPIIDIANDCNDVRAADELRATLREAHAVDTQIYALISFDQDDAINGSTSMIQQVATWNSECAKCPNEQFDGVALVDNKQHFSDIKCSGSGSEEAYLDRIWNTKVMAAAADLHLHMSIGWRWGQCDRATNIVNNLVWAPASQEGSNSSAAAAAAVLKPANEHLIDILDSVDVQVSSNVAHTMENRALTGGAKYAATVGKPFWVVAYTSPQQHDGCRSTFFPTNGCNAAEGILQRSEVGMWNAFDSIMSSSTMQMDATTTNGGIYHFRGAYGSGLPGWPEHVTGPDITTDLCGQDTNVFSRRSPSKNATPDDRK